VAILGWQAIKNRPTALKPQSPRTDTVQAAITAADCRAITAQIICSTNFG